MSKVSALFHIVFCTKQRKCTMPEAYHEDIYRFIWSEITNTKSKLLRIGGTRNHIHILVDLKASVSLADFVAVIKAKSSGWMKRDSRFPDFEGWAHEYFAASISASSKSGVIEYIKNQKIHHAVRGLDDEFRDLYASCGLVYAVQDMM